jgi:hypothetical protein
MGNLIQESAVYSIARLVVQGSCLYSPKGAGHWGGEE